MVLLDISSEERMFLFGNGNGNGNGYGYEGSYDGLRVCCQLPGQGPVRVVSGCRYRGFSGGEYFSGGKNIPTRIEQSIRNMTPKERIEETLEGPSR